MKLQEFLELPELRSPLMSYKSILKYLKIQKIEHSTKIHTFGHYNDPVARERLNLFKTVPLCYQYFTKVETKDRFWRISIELRGIEIKIPTDYNGNIILLRNLNI